MCSHSARGPGIWGPLAWVVSGSRYLMRFQSICGWCLILPKTWVGLKYLLVSSLMCLLAGSNASRAVERRTELLPVSCEPWMGLLITWQLASPARSKDINSRVSVWLNVRKDSPLLLLLVVVIRSESVGPKLKEGRAAPEDLNTKKQGPSQRLPTAVFG